MPCDVVPNYQLDSREWWQEEFTSFCHSYINRSPRKNQQCSLLSRTLNTIKGNLLEVKRICKYGVKRPAERFLLALLVFSTFSDVLVFLCYYYCMLCFFFRVQETL